VDSRLNLHDALSTAFFFSALAGSKKPSELAREAQWREAEDICRSVEPRRAVPFVFPRAAYLVLLLAGGAAGLFAARYGVYHSLDLRPPISRALVDFFRPSREEMAKATEPEPKLPDFDEIGMKPVKSGVPDRPGPDASPPSNVPALADADCAARRPLKPLEDSERAGDDWNTGKAPGKNDQSRGEEPEAPPPPSDKDKAAGEQKPASPPEEESDLIRKMQDAFANLLSKLKIPPMAGQGRRPSDRASAEAGRSEQAKGQQSQEAPEGSEGEGTPVADPGREQERAPSSSAGQGEGGDQLSNQPGLEQANSGRHQRWIEGVEG
jgi:hypothetical protein